MVYSKKKIGVILICGIFKKEDWWAGGGSDKGPEKAREATDKKQIGRDTPAIRKQPQRLCCAINQKEMRAAAPRSLATPPHTSSAEFYALDVFLVRGI